MEYPDRIFLWFCAMLLKTYWNHDLNSVTVRNIAYE